VKEILADTSTRNQEGTLRFKDLPHALKQLRLLNFYFTEKEGLASQKTFFDELNSDIKRLCEFRANNIFHCEEQYDVYNKVMEALFETARTDSERETVGLDKLRALKQASELKVEAQQLSVAYEQLMKLAKIIDAYVSCRMITPFVHKMTVLLQVYRVELEGLIQDRQKARQSWSVLSPHKKNSRRTFQIPIFQ
jgi:hypothetical protein